MVEQVFRWTEEFRRANLVRSAFGDPYQDEGRTVIPVASVAIRVDSPVGHHASSGSLPALEESTTARPAALISVGEDGVRVAPVGAESVLWLLRVAAAGVGVLAGWRIGRSWRT